MLDEYTAPTPRALRPSEAVRPTPCCCDAAMSAPGRNDPCPCGSGKKFNHCHLVRAQPSTGITPKDRSAAFDALLRYSGRDEFMEVVEDAALMWADEDIEDLGYVDDARDSILEFDTSRDTIASMLIKALKVEHRRLVRKRPDLAPAEFFKMVGPVFHLFWYDHVAMATPPDLAGVSDG